MEGAHDGEALELADAAAAQAQTQTGWTKHHRRRRQADDKVHAFGSHMMAHQQHVDNLLATVQEGLWQHDFPRVATAACLVIPQLQMRKVIAPSDRQRLARLLHAVEGSLECFHSGAAPLSGESLARLLRHVQGMPIAAGKREGVRLEQALVLALAGDLDHAYDVAVQTPSPNAGQAAAFACEATCGLIRHVQWLGAIRVASAQLAKGKGADGTPSEPEEPDWFALKPSVQTLAGRAALDFWRDAEKHLQSALAAEPAATELAYILVQMYAALGRHGQALGVAQGLRRASPEDANAHALYLLLAGPEGALGDEAAAEAVAACQDLLRCDAGAHSAMQQLLRLRTRRGLPAAALTECLLLHLDVCGDPSQLEGRGGVAPLCSAQPEEDDAGLEPTWGSAEGAPERRRCAAASWGALAEVLQSSAQRALALVEGAAAPDSAAADGCAAPADDRAGESGSSAAQQSAASAPALEEWHALEEVLGSRAWWWGRWVLRPGMAAAALASCGEDQLAAMAVAAAFVLGSSSSFCWEARAALAGSPARLLVEALNVRRRLMIAMGRELSPPRTVRSAVAAVRQDTLSQQRGPDVSGDTSQGQAEAGAATADVVGAGSGSAPEMAGGGQAAVAVGRKGKRGGSPASKARALAARTAKEGAVKNSPSVVQHRRRKRASGVTRAAL